MLVTFFYDPTAQTAGSLRRHLEETPAFVEMVEEGRQSVPVFVYPMRERRRMAGVKSVHAAGWIVVAEQGGDIRSRRRMTFMPMPSPIC